MTKGQRSSLFFFHEEKIKLKVLQYADFPTLVSLHLVDKNWHNAIPRGQQFCLLALRHLYGKETMQRMQGNSVMQFPTSRNPPALPLSQQRSAIVSPEKSWTTMPRWSLLCDHIFTLHSFFSEGGFVLMSSVHVGTCSYFYVFHTYNLTCFFSNIRRTVGTHVTTSLAIEILRDFMLFLFAGHSPTGSIKEEVQDLCADCGLLACTAISIAIKVEEGLTAQWDTCPVPSRVYGNNVITRESIIRAERQLLGCLSMAIPICHFGQYSFPMRLQLIKADEEYRHVTNTLGRTPSRSIPSRLSLTYQKVIHHNSIYYFQQSHTTHLSFSYSQYYAGTSPICSSCLCPKCKLSRIVCGSRPTRFVCSGIHLGVDVHGAQSPSNRTTTSVWCINKDLEHECAETRTCCSTAIYGCYP